MVPRSCDFRHQVEGEETHGVAVRDFLKHTSLSKPHHCSTFLLEKPSQGVLCLQVLTEGLCIHNLWHLETSGWNSPPHPLYRWRNGGQRDRKNEVEPGPRLEDSWHHFYSWMETRSFPCFKVNPRNPERQILVGLGYPTPIFLPSEDITLIFLLSFPSFSPWGSGAAGSSTYRRHILDCLRGSN